jgi:hypothetical protein
MLAAPDSLKSPRLAEAEGEVGGDCEGDEGFSAALLNFERWAADDVRQWVEAFPPGQLSDAGRAALLLRLRSDSSPALTGADLACCTNCCVVAAAPATAAAGASAPPTVAQTVAPVLEAIPGLSRADIFFLCDELDALRELRLLGGELWAAESARLPVEAAAVVEKAQDAIPAPSVGPAGLWPAGWAHQDAPPIALVPNACLHMNSDDDADDELDSERHEAVLPATNAPITSPYRAPAGPSAHVISSLCRSSAVTDADEFESVLEEAIARSSWHGHS